MRWSGHCPAMVIWSDITEYMLAKNGRDEETYNEAAICMMHNINKLEG